jgi:peptide/nickel transport system permease protein
MTMKGSGPKAISARTITWAASVVCLLVLACALFPQVLAPFSPHQQDLEKRFLEPLARSETGNLYPMGTDHLGRDILSRVIHGTRTSLMISLLSVLGGSLLGVLAGLVGGYYGGIVDSIMMRLVDIQLSFPFILLIIVAVAFLGPGAGNLIMILILATWGVYARVIRSSVISIKETQYVESAKSLGASDLRILLRHILPNTVTSIIVLATFQLARLILVEASVSYLGLGVTGVTWGGMVADGFSYLRSAWWASLLPALVISITVVSINILGDYLAEMLDPHLRQRLVGGGRSA